MSSEGLRETCECGHGRDLHPAGACRFFNFPMNCHCQAFRAAQPAAYDFEGNDWDDITEREKRAIVQSLYDRIQDMSDAALAAQPATGEGLREALAVLRDMSDDLADGVLAGVKPDDIGDADWEAANEALRAALQPASEENR